MHLAKTILVTLITSFTVVTFGQKIPGINSFELFVAPKKPFSPLTDSYLDRRLFLKNAPFLCHEAFLKNKITPQEVQRLISKYLIADPSVVKKIDASNDSTWMMDFEFTSKQGGFLRLLKNTASYAVTYRKSEDTIESIASMSFDTQCNASSDGSRFTFYNADLRPILRVKLNSAQEEVQSVVMEEPVHKVDVQPNPVGLVRIGFVDSGLDYNHKDLINKSRPMLGIDLTDSKRPPYDYANFIFNEISGTHFSHGTAVADVATRDVNALIIPARIENKSRLAGDAVEFLAKQGVRLINISQGTSKKEDWLPLQTAIGNHPEILFIVSSGNDSMNLDSSEYYPAVFTFPNLLVIASVNDKQELSAFSNYGATHVHFAALGENITAAEAGGGHWTVNGTSFSAPLVTNIAAKLLSENPKLTTQELRALLVATAKPAPQLAGKVQYGVLGL